MFLDFCFESPPDLIARSTAPAPARSAPDQSQKRSFKDANARDELAEFVDCERTVPTRESRRSPRAFRGEPRARSKARDSLASLRLILLYSTSRTGLSPPVRGGPRESAPRAGLAEALLLLRLQLLGQEPETDGLIAASRREVPAVGGEPDRRDAALVPLKNRQLLARRDLPQDGGVVMGPRHDESAVAGERDGRYQVLGTR